jgi:beta-galactosidase
MTTKSGNYLHVNPLPLLLAPMLVALATLVLPGMASHGSRAEAGEISDDGWRYTQDRPAGQWWRPDYDDSAWNEGRGGFGTVDTPGARVGTVWASPDIWIRRQVMLDRVPANPALLIHHDEDVQVFINGKQVFEAGGYTTQYQVVALADEARAAIRAGQNLIAVHCHQTGGGQFVDVHLVDGENVPDLPAPKRPTVPFKTDLITEWGEQVTPENAWTEYPRPSLVRDEWQNLNGNWQYAITADDIGERPETWDGQILVPFAIESKLSGVQRLLAPEQALWYRRTIEFTPNEQGHTLLHFEAVDYRCTVWVNGISVGGHVGGNTPFSLDITKAVREGSNEIVVRVEDETEGSQLNGKQSLNPRGIWYTQVSGIWQTVWIEQVPSVYVRELDVQTDPETGTITVTPTLAGAVDRVATWSLTVKDSSTAELTVGSSASQTIALPEARLWSPKSPHLYDLTIRLQDASGNTLDKISSYAGIRSVGKVRDDAGDLRFTLNGEVIFHLGPLDQGWWPDGLLTPPSDAAMLSDIEYLRDAGFNMIRKHIKVEPRRYYYHCDRLGMMVWQDQVSGGPNPPWTRMQPNPSDAQWTDADHAQFMTEFEEMVDDLEFHPSIVVWTPFNEAWGQHRTMEVGRWIGQRDPTRIVNVASGGNFWPVGDVADHHQYPHPGFPMDVQNWDDYIKVVGEFGGHGLPVRGHLYDRNRDNWGYGGLPANAEEYLRRYQESIRRLAELKKQGVAAGVYTQTSDVEVEINGLMTYDRRVKKIPAAILAELHRQLVP